MYEYEAFFLEIYNETIRDLLAPKGRKKEPRFDIKHDRDGTTSVTNMTVGALCLMHRRGVIEENKG